MIVLTAKTLDEAERAMLQERVLGLLEKHGLERARRVGVWPQPHGRTPNTVAASAMVSDNQGAPVVSKMNRH